MAVRKASLERTLRVIRCLFSEDGAWHVPQSFILPEEKEQLLSETVGTCIVKPSGGCRGEGITLAMTGAQAVAMISAAEAAEELAAASDESLSQGSNKKKSKPTWVVQEYIDRPLKVGSHKCDLRLYVILTEAAPTVKAWMCLEGMARVCVERYEEPNPNPNPNPKPNPELLSLTLTRSRIVTLIGGTKSRRSRMFQTTSHTSPTYHSSTRLRPI